MNVGHENAAEFHFLHQLVFCPLHIVARHLIHLLQMEMRVRQHFAGLNSMVGCVFLWVHYNL